MPYQTAYMWNNNYIITSLCKESSTYQIGLSPTPCMPISNGTEQYPSNPSPHCIRAWSWYPCGLPKSCIGICGMKYTMGGLGGAGGRGDFPGAGGIWAVAVWCRPVFFARDGLSCCLKVIFSVVSVWCLISSPSKSCAECDCRLGPRVFPGSEQSKLILIYFGCCCHHRGNWFRVDADLNSWMLRVCFVNFSPHNFVRRRNCGWLLNW